MLRSESSPNKGESKVKTWQTYVRVLLVLGSVAFLGGCIGLPLPAKTTVELIPKEKLSFLEVGQTTKAEVRQTLGKPWKIDLAENRWIYEVRRARSGRWVWCFSPGGGQGDCGVTEGKDTLYVLRIDFNDADVATGKKILKFVDKKSRDAGEVIYPIVYGSLEERDGLLFKLHSTTPYSGIHSWFHHNARLAGLVSITNGVKDGAYQTWHSDGRKDMEQHYENGILNGRSIVWYKNGQKYTQDHYKDNRLHGVSTSWDPDGTVSSQMCFQDGEYSDLTPENCTP